MAGMAFNIIGMAVSIFIDAHGILQVGPVGVIIERFFHLFDQMIFATQFTS